MMAVVAVLLFSLAGLGCGGAVLDLLGLGRNRNMAVAERLGWSAALGLGGLGWLLFILAAISRLRPLPVLLLVVILATAGYPGWRRSLATLPKPANLSWLMMALLATAALVAVLAMAEAVAPPTDGDSLAYHFALARQMADTGALVFVPRAIDGAVPLLLQITYAGVRVLGGEMAMTLWCTVTAWASALLLYGLARRWLSSAWSLALALVWLSIPAVVYGANSGQVEVRIALFVLAGTVALGRAMTGGGMGWVIAAGLAAGFFMASKYTGLLFAFALGASLLLMPGKMPLMARLRFAVVFSVAALVAGVQWYGWNWFNTGDPVFPMLARWLPMRDPALWPPGFESWSVGWTEGETAVPRTLAWLMAYPLAATFAPPPQFEAGRVGWGPLVIMLIPFALAGLWHRRARVVGHPLAIALPMLVLFAAIWFFAGPSQRVRHYVPFLPVVLLAGGIAAHRGAVHFGATRPLTAGFAVVLVLQLAGEAVYAKRYVTRLAGGQSREEFLRRSISAADAAAWVNAHLGSEERVVHEIRQINYLLDVPYYLFHSYQQALIDPRPGMLDTAGVAAAMARLGITHALEVAPNSTHSNSVMGSTVQAMGVMGCARVIHEQVTPDITSRTLDHSGGSTLTARVWALDTGCPALTPRVGR